MTCSRVAMNVPPSRRTRPISAHNAVKEKVIGLSDFYTIGDIVLQHNNSYHDGEYEVVRVYANEKRIVISNLFETHILYVPDIDKNNFSLFKKPYIKGNFVFVGNYIFDSDIFNSLKNLSKIRGLLLPDNRENVLKMLEIILGSQFFIEHDYECIYRQQIYNH